jgi:hypothetical protein
VLTGDTHVGIASTIVDDEDARVAGSGAACAEVARHAELMRLWTALISPTGSNM